jgi:hypothetical protein
MIFYSDFRDSDNDCKSNLFFFFEQCFYSLGLEKQKRD